jgi:hypothetical protein
MMLTRILTTLLLLLVLGYGIWPYVTLFQLDDAVADPDPKALAPFVDLPAVQQHYKDRLGGAVEAFVPPGRSDADQAIGWLAENLKRLGDTALDQAITLKWVQIMLRDGVVRATDNRQARFMAGIDFAFFESWDRFVVRLGALGDATHLVLRLQGWRWRMTDIVRS